MSDFVVDKQLCVALHAASRAMTARYRMGLAPLGLTYPQYMVMLVLWEHRSVTMSFLSDEVSLDSATMSPLLKRLQAQGLITRQRRDEDERTLQITLTERGGALYEPVKVVQAEVERDCALSPGQLAALRDELQGLGSRLRAATER